MDFKNKAISPIIGTILLIVITAIIGVSTFQFLQDFSQESLELADNNQLLNDLNTKVIDANENRAYVQTPYENLNISRVILDGNDCSNNSGISSSKTLELNLSSCSGNVTSSRPQLIIESNEGIIQLQVRELRTLSNTNAQQSSPSTSSLYYPNSSVQNQAWHSDGSLDPGCTSGVCNSLQLGSPTAYEYTASDLDDISTSSNNVSFSLQIGATPVYTYEMAHRYKIDIDENSSQVSQIDITSDKHIEIDACGPIGGGINNLDLRVSNFNTNSWELLDQDISSNSSKSLTLQGSLTSNFNNYINTSGSNNFIEVLLYYNCEGSTYTHTYYSKFLEVEVFS